MTDVPKKHEIHKEPQFETAEQTDRWLAERLAVRKLVGEQLAHNALHHELLTTVPPCEKSPDELTDSECLILLAIHESLEDEDGPFPAVSLDPTKGFYTLYDSFWLQIESVFLDRLGEGLDIAALAFAKPTEHTGKEREYIEADNKFVRECSKRRLVDPIYGTDFVLWKEWRKAYPRLHSSETNRRARRFLRNHLQHDLTDNELKQTLEPTPALEQNDWVKEVISKLSKGSYARYFRFFLKHRRVTFNEFICGEDPATLSRLTKTENLSSVRAMLGAFKKDLLIASDGICELKVDSAKCLATLIVNPPHRRGNSAGNSK